MTSRLALTLLALVTTALACGDKPGLDTGDDTGEADADTDTDTDTDSDTDADSTGACSSDLAADTACVDVSGDKTDVTAGAVAWDGQGSLAGSVRMMWGGGDTLSDPPSLIIDIPNTVSSGDTVSCADRPTYVLFTDAAGAKWHANTDFAYWGGECTVTIDTFSLEPGDEIVGSFTGAGVNADYTADSFAGTFRATVVQY